MSEPNPGDPRATTLHDGQKRKEDRMKANAAERKIVEDAMTLPAELVALITRPRPEDEAGPPHWSHVDRGELERFLSILGGKAVAEGASPGAGRSSKSKRLGKD